MTGQQGMSPRPGASPQAKRAEIAGESADRRRFARAYVHTGPQAADRPGTGGRPLRMILLYDGAGVSAWLDRNPSAETAARTAAAGLVNAAIPD